MELGCVVCRGCKMQNVASLCDTLPIDPGAVLDLARRWPPVRHCPPVRHPRLAPPARWDHIIYCHSSFDNNDSTVMSHVSSRTVLLYQISFLIHQYTKYPILTTALHHTKIHSSYVSYARVSIIIPMSETLQGTDLVPMPCNNSSVQRLWWVNSPVIPFRLSHIPH